MVNEGKMRGKEAICVKNKKDCQHGSLLGSQLSLWSARIFSSRAAQPSSTRS